MIYTVFIYTAVLLICFFLARKARKTQRLLFVAAIVGVLTLLAGLRADSVGIDTPTYVSAFELICHDNFDYVYGMEYSFKLIMLLISKVSNNYTFFLLLMALLTNGLIILRLWEFKELSRFEWMVVVYYVTFYFFDFNIMRQMCAVAIVFWGSRYISKGKYIKFGLCLIFAMLFHTSALFGMSLLIIEYTRWRILSDRQKYFLMAGASIAPIAGIYIINKLSKYSRYLSNVELQIGTILFVKIVFLILSQWKMKKIVICKESKMNRTDDIGKAIELGQQIDLIKIYYFCGLLMGLLGYMAPFADRMSLYLYIFECVYIGSLMKYRKIDTGIPIAIVMLYGAIFAVNLKSGGQGQMPYLFFWQ